MLWKSYLLARFAGKHSENPHALSPDEAHTQPGRIHQISVTNI